MEKVFENIILGGIEVQNRIVRSATVVDLASEDGYVTESLINEYETLAKNDVGLIITGTIGVHKNDQFDLKNLRIHDDSFSKGLRSLTDMVHRHGSKIIAQLSHSSTLIYKESDIKIWAPSDVEDIVTKKVGHSMTTSEVEEFIQSVISGAVRAKKAGFDGVQIHAAHGYMISKFLTPHYNNRADKYGGTFNSRARILIDIINGIKDLCGDTFPVFAKINASDFVTEIDQFNEYDSTMLAKLLAEAGYDAIEISGGIAGTMVGPARRITKKRGNTMYHKKQAVYISRVVDIDIILCGGIKLLTEVEDVLKESKIKAVSISRSFIAEPDLVHKWQKSSEYYSKCLTCNKCFTPGISGCPIFRR